MSRCIPSFLLAATLGAIAPAAAQAPPIVLTARQRATLAALGWPPPPPSIKPRDDIVLRRGTAPSLSGSLTGLHAFATMKTSRGVARIPRDDIRFILVNRHLVPRNAPALPLDTDAVLLANGRDVLVGRVEVDSESIHVNSRVVQQAAVAVIHLRDPANPSRQQAQDASAGAAAAEPVAAGAERRPADGQTAAPRPKGPAELPWGKGLWRGYVRFTIIEQDDPRQEAHGSYYVTWSEEPSAAVGARTTQIKLHPVSLEYQYQWSIAAYPQRHCSAFNLTKSGTGFDGVDHDVQSGGTLDLELLPGARVGNENAGLYLVNIFSPDSVDDAELPVNCAGPPEPMSWGASSDLRTLPNAILESETSAHNCKGSVPVFRAAPPFVTIAGDLSCGTPGDGNPLKTFRWHFDRGVPPVEAPVTGHGQDVCEAPRGLLTGTEDQRRAALARLAQIRAEFAKAKDDEARLRATRNQLQGAFDLLLIASAGSDVGKKLLTLATGDEAMEAAAGTGEVTEEERAFVKQMNEFIKAYQTWTQATDDPAGWGVSQLLTPDSSQHAATAGKDMVDAALEMVNLGQVLGGAIGAGNPEATGDYIEENLGAFGPLVPDYALSKARQYVEVTKQWGEAMRELARIAAEGAGIAGQIAESDLGIKVLGQRLQACVGQ